MNYFTNLEFLPEESLDDVQLGRNQQRRRWTAATYVLFSLGIFSRQITAFPKVDVAVANIRWSVLAASFVIGLALFPPVMRWLNRRRKRPSFEHVLTAFSIGFFIDLAAAGSVMAARAAKLFPT